MHIKVNINFLLSVVIWPRNKPRTALSDCWESYYGRPDRETLFKGEWNVLLVKSIATSLKGNVVGCDGMKCHKTQEMLMNQASVAVSYRMWNVSGMKVECMCHTEYNKQSDFTVRKRPGKPTCFRPPRVRKMWGNQPLFGTSACSWTPLQVAKF